MNCIATATHNPFERKAWIPPLDRVVKPLNIVVPVLVWHTVGVDDIVILIFGKQLFTIQRMH